MRVLDVADPQHAEQDDQINNGIAEVGLDDDKHEGQPDQHRDRHEILREQQLVSLPSSQHVGHDDDHDDLERLGRLEAEAARQLEPPGRSVHLGAEEEDGDEHGDADGVKIIPELENDAVVHQGDESHQNVPRDIKLQHLLIVAGILWIPVADAVEQHRADHHEAYKQRQNADIHFFESIEHLRSSHSQKLHEPAQPTRPLFQLHQRNHVPQYAPGDVAVSDRSPRARIHDGRFAGIRRLDDSLIVWNDAEQIDCQHLADLVDVQHFPVLDHRGADAVDDELGRNLGALQQADHPVGIAHGGILGSRDDNRPVGAGYRVAEALLDAGRTVDDDIIVFPLQLQDDVLDLLRRDVGLVLRLGGGQHVQLLEPLVLDERLLQAAAPLCNVHEIVDDPVLKPHDDVQIAQADIGIDHGHFFAQQSKGSAQIGRCRRLADPAFARCDDDCFSHAFTPL